MIFPLGPDMRLLGGRRDGYFDKVLSYSPLVYYPMDEASGVTAINYGSLASADGTYTGVTLGQLGIGDGRTSALFDKVNDENNIYSAALAGAFNPNLLTVSTWMRVDAGTWTDGLYGCLFSLFSSSSNNVIAYKSATNNTIEFQANYGGVFKTRLHGSMSSTSFIHVAVTVDKAGDALKFYVDGVQSGATLTGLGIWVGSLLSTLTKVGRWSTSFPFGGNEAHFAIFSSVLSDAAILDLATVV